MSTPRPDPAPHPAPDPAPGEAAARRVLLVQAFETGPADNPQWTAEDRRWATRMACEATPEAAGAEEFLDTRARFALQRLAPRDAGVGRLLGRRGWRALWGVMAALLGGATGLAVDSIGSGQRINLLAPPVWGVIAWNLLVYAALVLPAPEGPKAWLGRRLAGRSDAGSALARFHAAWARQAAPLFQARAALLLHVAAAALALGLVAGLYLRGLVLDYRAGWQSTFLDAEQVRRALAALLAPASALTGIAVPDVASLQALRVAPEALPVASAAPWIHLYAAMLVTFVVVPRALLAVVAAWRARQLARRLPLALEEPYFQRLLREQQGRTAQVQVLAHGARPSAHALACLHSVLAPVLGSGVGIHVATGTAYGDEEAAAALHAGPDTTLRLALFDLAATPEDDSHGAFVRALRAAAPGVPLLLLVDETALRVRYASLPARLAERRAAWQKWAQGLGLALVCIDLAEPDAKTAESALTAALQR